jgi:hypothetical protein
MLLDDGAVQVNESSLMAGHCSLDDTWSHSLSAAFSLVRSLNSSNNVATGRGSGFADATTCDVSMEFCSFKSNGNRNCLLIDYWNGSSSILSHLLFMNNSCASSIYLYPGLLYAL